ncbi:MAG TPA: hypothetical protein VET26_03340, partial [Candidatus Sulfotelmatobacter sp.]|nr:hypothetical protein [Candidatus Sulfotelmatobacter sp.]
GGSALLSQLGGLFNPGHVSSFTGRVSINRTALHGWLRRPIFGWGAGAFLYVYGAAAGGWIGNLELHALFDSGLAGFLFLVVALLLNAWRAGRQLAGGVGAWTPTHFVLFGLVAAGLALLATYQFTEGTWLGFTWVYFGMLAAAGVTAAAEIRLIPAARDGSGNGAVAFRLGWSKTRTPQSPSA